MSDKTKETERDDMGVVAHEIWRRLAVVLDDLEDLERLVRVERARVGAMRSSLIRPFGQVRKPTRRVLM